MVYIFLQQNTKVQIEQLSRKQVGWNTHLILVGSAFFGKRVQLVSGSPYAEAEICVVLFLTPG